MNIEYHIREPDKPWYEETWHCINCNTSGPFKNNEPVEHNEYECRDIQDINNKKNYL